MPALTHTTVPIDSAESGRLVFDVLQSRVDGPQVVALHGYPQGARAWEQVATLLAERGIGLHAIDQRGYSPGARPVGVEHYGDRTLAADVIAVAEQLGLSTFHLAGHDWGSHIAWVSTALNPGRVRSLTAVSIPHPGAFGQAYREDPDQKGRSGYMKLFWQPGVAETEMLADDAARLRESLDDVPAEQKEHYVSRLQQPGALTAALSWYRAMSSKAAQTPAVTVPTTMVWSDGDRAVGRRSAELCEQYVDADYRFVELNGISHWIPERAPEQLADAIAHRISSVEQP